MLPYAYPDGAVVFRRDEGGEFIVRPDERGRWHAFFRVTVIAFNYADAGSVIDATHFRDEPLRVTGTGRAMPSEPTPGAMMRAVQRAIAADALMPWSEVASDRMSG